MLNGVKLPNDAFDSIQIQESFSSILGKWLIFIFLYSFDFLFTFSFVFIAV